VLGGGHGARPGDGPTGDARRAGGGGCSAAGLSKTGWRDEGFCDGDDDDCGARSA
jgi:hypothetical protein